MTQVKLEQNKMFEMRRFFLCLDSLPQLEIYHGITFQNYADRLQAGPASELAKENSGKKSRRCNCFLHLYPRCSGKSECEKNFISAEEVAELEQWQKASKVQPACDYNE